MRNAEPHSCADRNENATRHPTPTLSIFSIRHAYRVEGGGPTVAGSVVKLQIGPAAVPLPFFATICQKYMVLGFSRGVAYQYSVMFDATVGGGFVVPNRTSYDVAPSDRQLSVGVTVTQVVALAGFGELGGAGPSGPPVGSVLKLQMGPAVVPT